MRRARAVAVVAVVAALGAGLAILGGCDDALDQRLAILDHPRVLAIVAEPAEGKPGASVAYSLLYAGPDGPLAADAAWAYCHAPKAPTEDTSVSPDCLGDTALIPLPTGAAIAASLPADTCFVYGPETKPGGFRPRDADATGGFYQPVRAAIDGELAFGLSRIQCALANVAPELSRRYDREYVANGNPVLDSIGIATALPDTDVELVASWPAAAAESYLYYDPLARALVTRREAMRVSWFATGGALAVDASAVGEDDPATTVRTSWHTPAAPGRAYLVFVLRDSRGGLATRTAAVDLAN